MCVIPWWKLQWAKVRQVFFRGGGVLALLIKRSTNILCWVRTMLSRLTAVTRLLILYIEWNNDKSIWHLHVPLCHGISYKQAMQRLQQSWSQQDTWRVIELLPLRMTAYCTWMGACTLAAEENYVLRARNLTARNVSLQRWRGFQFVAG